VLIFWHWLDYPQGRNPWCPLARRLSGSLGRSGHSSKEKKSYPFHEWNPSHPAHSLVIVITTIPGQLYHIVKLYISGSYFHNCMCASCNILKFVMRHKENVIRKILMYELGYV
jgi:hypothetical protein